MMPSNAQAKFHCLHGMPTYTGMSIILIVKMDKVNFPVCMGTYFERGMPSIGHLDAYRHPGCVFWGMPLLT